MERGGVQLVKPTYRSSHMIHYDFCPQKFYLSTKHEQKRTKAMTQGLLFEGYLFGFENEAVQFHLEGRKYNKDGKERKMSEAQLANLERIKKKAAKIQEIFQFKGQKFKKYVIEYDEFFIQGELDFKGDFVYNGEPRTGIVDTKFTSDIDRIWNYKNSKGDYFQSVMYPFLELCERNKTQDLNLFKSDKPLPFYYLVVEDNDYEDILYKLIPVEVNKNDMKWIWRMILQIHKARELGYPAYNSIDNCLGVGAYSGRCPLLQWCKKGRNEINFEHKVVFSQLNETK